jgi:hypothetical protein
MARVFAETGSDPLLSLDFCGRRGVPRASAHVILAALTDRISSSPWKKGGVAWISTSRRTGIGVATTDGPRCY